MKYQFVKKRPDISAKEVQSFKDFDSVLSASQQVTGLGVSAKLLWGLAAIPVIGLVYFLTINQLPSEEPGAASALPTTTEEVHPTTQGPVEKLEKAASAEETKGEPKSKPEEANITKSQTQQKGIPTQQHPKQQVPKAKPDNEVKKEDIYLNAEPKNGFELFYAFVESELTYPELARKDSVQGHVKLMFSIDVDGSLKDVSIAESLGELFDNEAIRVIKRSPRWKPATFNGYPVSSRMSIKLTFELE